MPLACAQAAAAQNWTTGPQHVDVMLIAAHPDDEQLFLGAIIPLCAQQGRSAVTVIVSNGYNPMRKWAAVTRPKEARNGLWAVGERQEPVIGTFEDHRYSSMRDAKKFWPEDKVVPFLVEQIRKYTPTVIVSQDVNGEYGHLAHKLMVQYVQEAFDLSGNPTYCPDTAKEYGVWNPLKLFLHLYSRNQIVLDTDAPLSVFGGKTAFEMAKLGYSCHKSQIKSGHHAVSERAYSIRDFGLAASRVGYAVDTNDLFESVDLAGMLRSNPDMDQVSKTLEYKTWLEENASRESTLLKLVRNSGSGYGK